MDFRFFKFTNKFWVIFLLLVLIANRGIINYILPLMDKTEARYAEIARIMITIFIILIILVAILVLKQYSMAPCRNACALVVPVDRVRMRQHM